MVFFGMKYNRFWWQDNVTLTTSQSQPRIMCNALWNFTNLSLSLYKWHVSTVYVYLINERVAGVFLSMIQKWYENVQLNQSISILKIDVKWFTILQLVFFHTIQHRATEVAQLLNDGMINNKSITRFWAKERRGEREAAVKCLLV